MEEKNSCEKRLKSFEKKREKILYEGKKKWKLRLVQKEMDKRRVINKKQQLKMLEIREMEDLQKKLDSGKRL